MKLKTIKRINLMRFKHLFMGFVAAIAFSACSDDVAQPDNGNGIPDDSNARYMSVTIRNSNPVTRAGGDQTSVESNGNVYEEGYIDENEVKSIRFYFFKADGNPAPVRYTGENFYDCQDGDVVVSDPIESNMPNVEKILNALIVINYNADSASADDIKQLVAVVNFKNIEDELGTTSKSLSQLSAILASPDKCSNETNGFLMTNSAYYAENYGSTTEIKKTDLQSSADLARQNPVDVYVERLVAKVRVRTQWNEEMETPVTATLNGVQVQAIPLQNKEDGVRKPITVDDGKRVYLVFNNWKLWWTADKSYILKKVSNWDSSSNGLGWTWNDPSLFRSYWAENPVDMALVNYTHNSADKLIGTSTAQTYKDYSEYCLENAADPSNNGMKANYDPDSSLTNRTLVYLNATLVTLDANNVATPLPLVEWVSRKYTESDALAAMFAPVENIVYFRSETATSTDANGAAVYTYMPVTVNDLQFVSAAAAGQADYKSENSKRYLSYLNLKTDNLYADRNGVKVQQGVLYKKNASGDFEAFASTEDPNDVFESVGGAKIWRNGHTYYYHEITHLGTTGVDGGGNRFSYGIVRNHIYDVVINSVFGLGTPVLSPKDEEKGEWEPIIPQKPLTDTYFLGARVDILSWRLVNNNVSLDWSR